MSETQDIRIDGAEGGVAWSVADGIGRIVLDRGGRPNTVSNAAGAGFARAVAAVLDAHPRVVLLTGRGALFCAGGDIEEFKTNTHRFEPYVDALLTVVHPAIERLAEAPVPVVVAINGAVGGAGLGLALCGDFALAAASVKMRTGYAAIGMSPDVGASYFVARRVGATRAKQLFMLSEPVDAQAALAMGLVDEVVPDAELAARADALCARLAKAATGALGAIRQLCDGASRRTLHEHLALEKALIERRASSEDAREGIAAFLGKRAPQFGGR